jgi:hypothetical protein
VGPVGPSWGVSGVVSGNVPTSARLRPVDGGADNLLPVRQVAARLGVSTATVYALCERGALPHLRVSYAIRVSPGDAGIFAAEVSACLQSLGFDIRAQIIWAKQHIAISRGAYHWQHEPCWYAVRKRPQRQLARGPQADDPLGSRRRERLGKERRRC